MLLSPSAWKLSRHAARAVFDIDLYGMLCDRLGRLLTAWP